MIRDSEFRVSLINSIVIALLTLLSIPMGLALAIVIHKVEIPGAKYIEPMIIIPMFISPIIWGFAWLYMYGPSGFLPRLWGDIYGVIPVGLISAIIHVPHAYVILSTALLSIDSSFEEVARIHGAGPLRTIFSILIPMMKPSIVFSAVILFVLGLEQFGVPLVLAAPIGDNVLTTYIYQLVTLGVEIPYSYIAVVASIIIYTALTLLIIQRYLVLKLSKRYVTVTGRIRGFTKIRVSRPVALALLSGVLVYIVFFIALPLAAVVARSLSPLYGSGYQITLSFYETIATSAPLRTAVVNTVLVAVIAASISIPIYLGYALTILKSRSRIESGIVDIASTLPRAMPGLVVGLAFLWLYLFTPLRPLLYSLLGLAVAYVILWSIFGIRVILTNMIQISSELEEVARVHGASQSTVLTRITIPLLRRAILVTWLIIFIYGIREYSVPVFLSTKNPVIGSTIVLLIGSGELGIIAGLATISVAITLAATVIIFKLGWKPYGAIG